MMRTCFRLKILLCLGCFLPAVTLPGVIIQIGNGSLVNQCLPVEPLVNYSYSQSIYTAAEVGSGGYISALGFQYLINSSIFLPYTNDFSIYLGEVSRDRFNSITDWVPLDSLQLVFQGVLQPEWFSSALPGQGWLTIPFTHIYDYNGIANLVIAVDENRPGNSNSGDDFYCSAAAYPQSLELHSMTVNPDPALPPAGYPGNPLSVRPNLRLDIQPVIYEPHNPQPAHLSTGVSLTPTLSWQSNAAYWDVWFGPTSQPLQLVAENLATPAWTVPNQLSLLTSYHWQVVAHTASNDYESPVWSFTTQGEDLSAPLDLQGMALANDVHLQWQPPLQGTIVSYDIFRNQLLIGSSQTTYYLDEELSPGSYLYYVVAVNYLNQSSPPSNPVSFTIQGSPADWLTDFESYADFTVSLPAWTLLDGDNTPTWQFSGFDFPGEGSALSWIVFNPYQTVPPVTTVLPYDGQKMLFSISTTSPPNNDWLISPCLEVGTGAQLSFWARSYTADYGLERLRVLLSETDSQISSFVPLSPEPWLAVPPAWTQYIYDLSAYAGEQIYLAWNCVSWDALALCLDAIRLTQSTGSQDQIQPPEFHLSVYPNPAAGQFTIKSSSGVPFSLNIYNTKGQKLLEADNITTYQWTKNSALNLPAGIYLIRAELSNRHYLQKLLLY